MATNRQAAARPLEQAPEHAPAEDSRRRWVQATGQIDDGAETEPFPGFPAPGVTRARAAAPAPAPPTERLTFAPARSGVPFAQQRAQQAPDAVRVARPANDRLRLVGLAVAGVLGILALYVALSALFGFVQVKLDDMQYGRPRTTHLDAYVGHAGEQPGQPSHFLALNLDRRIVVIELPGGDTKNATTITGPYLFGDNEDLTPVKLATSDVNNDGVPDLVLTVKNEELIYINDKAKNSFHLLTPDERAKLPASPGTGGAGPTQGAGR